MTREEIVEQLTRAADLTGPGLAEAGYADRVQAIREAITAGEYKLAAEDLTSNLYEFDCPVPPEAFSLLKDLGTQLGLPADAWGDLEALVTHD